MAKAPKTGGALSEGQARARASPVPSRPASPTGRAAHTQGQGQVQARASTSQLLQVKPKQKLKQQQSRTPPPAPTHGPDRTGTLLKIDLALWVSVVRPSHKTAFDWISRNLTLHGLSTSALGRDPGGLKIYELLTKNGKRHLYIGGGKFDASPPSHDSGWRFPTRVSAAS